jgi:signal recognition particle subunit SRP54
MGNINQLIGMIPGINQSTLKDAEVDENHLSKIEAIILSMTKKERLRPELINGSRRKRIANGSGTTVEDVNKLLKQFEQMKKTMKQFSNMGKRRSFAGMKLPF